MKILLILALLHAIAAFKPPTIDVEDHNVQQHASIGRFVELKEHDSLTLKCAGRNDDVKFNFPNMEIHRGFDQNNFNDRMKETMDDDLGDVILTINDVHESDTGTYSCSYMEHQSLNDTIHVFVTASSLFLPLTPLAFSFNEGEIVIPCKTTQFVENNDIELYANNVLVKSASKNFDQRYGFSLTKKMYDVKSIRDVRFECRYKPDPSQEVDYLITEKDPSPSDNDFKFYWDTDMDWPYVSYNYTMVCHLVYTGKTDFQAFENNLHVQCPQCSSDAGSHVFADRNRLAGNRISVAVRIDHLELEDSGNYSCIWRQEGKEEKVIVKNIHVAPKKAQIKIVERSPQLVRMKEGHPISLSSKFAIYPSDGESYVAKWSRMYNSSIKDGPQSETIINDDYRTITTSTFGKGVYSDTLAIAGAAVSSNQSGTYVLSISHQDTVQVLQWEVAIENFRPEVKIAIREPSSFIVFNQQFYPPDTHLHIDCVSVSIPPAGVVFEKRTRKTESFKPIDPSQLTQAGGTFENGYIWNVTLTDDIEIRCSSERHGRVNSTTKSIRVADEAPSAYSKIEKSDKATSSEDPKGLYEGDHVQLVCAVPIGAEDWNVFWRYENRSLRSETEVKGHSKHVVLKLRDVTMSSSGKYTCVVKNGEQEKNIEQHVTVEKTSRPYHTNADSMSAVTVDYDQTFVIDCNMAGVPAPEFRWFKNGNPYLHGDPNGSTLTVTRARAEDDGQFHCLATNRAGNISNIITVNVRGAPKGGSLWFFVIIIIIISFVFLVCITVLFIKLRNNRRITKQKDVALKELYENMMRENQGPPPENLKELPINERIAYLPYKMEFEIARENIEFCEKIGSGMFGNVHKAFLQMADPKSQMEYKTRLPVAIKSPLNSFDIAQQRMLAEELRIMCAIGKHPNVLALVGAVTANMRKGQLFLVTELAENGNLRDYLTARRKFFIDELEEDDVSVDDSYMVPNSVKTKKYRKLHASEEDRLLNSDDVYTSDLVSFAMQVANGMEYLASIPCVHRDLACRNVLLTQNKIVRIADFGLAKRHDSSSYYRTKKSKNVPIPLRWMPVEALEQQIFTQESDVWSFGICLYEIFTLGGNPYPDVTNESVLGYIKSGQRNAQPKYCHDQIYDLMKLCWMEKPVNRPNFTYCVQFLKDHMQLASKELLQRVDDMLRIEVDHQAKLESWIRPTRPDIPGCSFTKPPKKHPEDERYHIVESHA